jgi:hypothetical protein
MKYSILLFNLNIVLLLAILFFALQSSLFAQDPPKGLEWEMTYEQVKANLKTLPKNEESKVGKLVKSSSKIGLGVFKIPTLPGANVATFDKNLEIADEKINTSYLYFHPQKGLCSVYYQCRFIKDYKDKAWNYFKRVQTILSAKYGEPDKSIPLDMPHVGVLQESPYKANWIFEDGRTISLSLGSSKSFIENFYVEIQYCTNAYYELIKEALKDAANKEDLL